MLNLEIPKIDSVRIHIPFDEITVTNKTTFLDSMVTYSQETGEIDSEHIKTTHYTRNNGIAGSYAKLKMLNGIFGEKEYLVIGFSAKFLKEKYFTGINKENIKYIYNYLMDEGVVEFPLESLIKAKVVDTDICQDFVLEGVNCEEVVKISYQLSKAHKKTDVNQFTKDINRGIQWGDRKKVGKAYKTKQYLKYYAKALELKHNSKDFYLKFLKDDMNKIVPNVTVTNLLRVETTIKNNAHWETYGLQVKTLGDLLDLDLEAHKEIFHRPIRHYMTGENSIRIKTDLNFTELSLLMLIDNQMKMYDLDYASAIVTILNQTTKKKDERSKKKKYLTVLYEGQILANQIKKGNSLDVIKNYSLIPN